MEELKCKQCGAPLDLLNNRYPGADGYSYIKCSHCKVTYREETPEYSAVARDFYTQGKLAFDKQRFEDAITYFDNAISNAKGHYEAYWFRLLADNGIEYVLDPLDGKRKPTCHRCNDKPLMEQKDFKSACQYAPSEDIRKSYEASAKEIDKIRQSVLNQSKSGVDFDVFISFKKTELDADGNEIVGRASQDCITAEKLYHRLKNEYDLKVFYSEETLKNVVGSDFEATIFRALDTAKVFILVGSKTEYINAPWVKNEWMRYYRMMAQGKKIEGSLLYVYPNNIPNNLNRELATRQALKFNDPDFYPSLMKAIKRAMDLSDQGSRMDRRKLESKIETGREVTSQLTRRNRDFSQSMGKSHELADEQKLTVIENALAAKNFSDAEAMLNVMLSKAPNNPRLNFLKFLADAGIPDKNTLIAMAAREPKYIQKLDSIIGLCAETDAVLTDILQIIATLFKNACGAKNYQVAIQTFTILCQCSNLKLIQKNMVKLVEQMSQLANKLFDGGNTKASKQVFKHMLNAIGLCDKFSAQEKSLHYADYNANYATKWHKANNYVEAANYYGEAINYNPNSSRFYYLLWEAKQSVPYDTIAVLQGNDFGQEEVEKVLVHSENKVEQVGYISTFVDYAVKQVENHNIKKGNPLFEYVISVIPSEDVKSNQDIILKYSGTLVKYGYFADARKYLTELLKLTDNKCDKAYWLMVYVDLECKNDDELLLTDKVVSLQELPSYTNALSCAADEDPYKMAEYMNFNNRKLATYEQSRVAKGTELLAHGNFQEAKEVFAALLDFEKNTRKKREGTDYPFAYWGLMLADIKCKSTAQLATKEFRTKYPLSALEKMPNYKNYKAAYDRWHARNKSQKAHSEITALNQMRRNDERYYVEKSKLDSKRFGFVAMIFLVIAVIIGAGIGTYFFFKADISLDWFEVLQSAVPIMAGVMVGVPAGIGAIIGFIIGFKNDWDLEEAVGTTAAGGGIGAAGGAALMGLVFASCWALVPIIAIGIIVGMGFAMHAVKGVLNRQKRRVETAYGNMPERKGYVEPLAECPICGDFSFDGSINRCLSCGYKPYNAKKEADDTTFGDLKCMHCPHCGALISGEGNLSLVRCPSCGVVVGESELIASDDLYDAGLEEEYDDEDYDEDYDEE